MMKRILVITFTLIITSCYIFPFNPTIFPIVNTKQVLAVAGAIFLMYAGFNRRNAMIDKGIFIVGIYAVIVSLIGLISITFNNTPDYTYVTYIVSMCVWLVSAYGVVSFIRWIYGSCSVYILGNCLIGVCVSQCLLAIAVDLLPEVKSVVDAIQGPSLWLESVNRLYGLGAALDTAGIRFSIALTINSYFIVRIQGTKYQKFVWWYVVSFVLISVLGNMVARTTSVGVVVGLLYLLGQYKLSSLFIKIIRYFLGTLIVVIPICVYLYQTNDSFHDYMRFAFEGFFSLAEKGAWEIASNEKLKSMYVFPDNLKTWIIGDGYMVNPYFNDPFYIGEYIDGYYMGTDVGYLRFIFYFGIIGLMTFILFFCKVTQVCINKHTKERYLLLLFLLVNFIVWFKVSTDCFCVFALFLLITQEENESFNSRIFPIKGQSNL